VLVGLLLPTAVAGIERVVGETKSVDSRESKTVENGGTALISYQGGNAFAKGGGVIALDRSSNEVIWSHTAHRKYYDVDPVSDDRILITAAERSSDQWYAFIIDWRTNETISRFPVPVDTHDVDKIGKDQFAVADKAAHRAYVYNTSTNSITWEYNFTQDYTPADGGPYETDWTHLNDIDLVSNGSHFLLSPRNFDRVMLVNRSTQEITWELGEQGNYSTLFGQHDPVIIDSNPVTILIGDSRNHRAVEYQYRDGSWDQTWVHYGNLRWPRDVDRLPSGNTIITDTGNDRVVEITPEGDVVWEYTTEGERGFAAPYDVEILRHGDEPRGPAMTDTVDERPDPNSLRHQYRNAIFYLANSANFVLPGWINFREFRFLLAAGGVAGVWITSEMVLYGIRLYRR
jgi:hypothetical protein